MTVNNFLLAVPLDKLKTPFSNYFPFTFLQQLPSHKILEKDFYCMQLLRSELPQRLMLQPCLPQLPAKAIYWRDSKSLVKI